MSAVAAVLRGVLSALTSPKKSQPSEALRRTTMETLQNILAEHRFAQGLEDRHVALLTGCAANVHFNAGQVIFREGEEANQFYLVRDGKLAVELFAAERGAITILTLTAGEVLGWSWLPGVYAGDCIGWKVSPDKGRTRS